MVVPFASNEKAVFEGSIWGLNIELFACVDGADVVALNENEDFVTFSAGFAAPPPNENDGALVVAGVVAPNRPVGVANVSVLAAAPNENDGASVFGAPPNENLAGSTGAAAPGLGRFLPAPNEKAGATCLGSAFLKENDEAAGAAAGVGAYEKFALAGSEVVWVVLAEPNENVGAFGVSVFSSTFLAPNAKVVAFFCASFVSSPFVPNENVGVAGFVDSPPAVAPNKKLAAAFEGSSVLPAGAPNEKVFVASLVVAG